MQRFFGQMELKMEPLVPSAGLLIRSNEGRVGSGPSCSRLEPSSSGRAQKFSHPENQQKKEAPAET